MRTMIRPYFVVTILLLAFVPLPAPGDEPAASQQGGVGLGYEVWTLPASERLGIAELAVWLDQGRSAYTGLSVFAALAGQRGGFFTGGLKTGLRQRLNTSLVVDVGLFVGGGGGGSAPQGGGLMARAHAGLLFHRATWDWGLSWSRVRFPNGAIDSRQWSLMLQRPLRFTVSSGWLTSSASASADVSSTDVAIRRLAIDSYHYFPHSGSRDTAGQLARRPLRLLGFSLDFSWQRWRHWHSYAGVQTAGALAGDSDGYAELLGSYSLDYHASPSWSAQLRLALGAAGGGRVATGGGLLGRAELALLYAIDPAWQAAFGIGRVAAPQGHFGADVLALSLSHRYGSPAAAVTAWPETYAIRHWRFGISGQRYQSAQRSMDGGSAPDLDLLAGRVDWMLNENVYLSGVAASAYAGDAGGYATGQFGLGWRRPMWRRLYSNAEAFVGAGGGGGVDVGGGLLLQYQLGLEWRLAPQAHYGLQATIGHVGASDGDLDSTVIGLGLLWYLSSPGQALQQ
jgi:hypothetical protein